LALNLSRAAIARIAPFAAAMVLHFAWNFWPAHAFVRVDPHWLSAGGDLLVAGLLVWFWREYGELVRQSAASLSEAALAVVVGLSVFVLWINLGAPWMRLGQASPSFVPVDELDHIEWPLVIVRGVAATLVMPVMEELFWRSFLMRWIQSPKFESVPPQAVGLRPIVLCTFIFTLAHTQWVAAVIAGLAYALLYIRTGKLWVAIIAHAATNVALGVWVVASKQWSFW
jgi:CAAX prenyl protease-like protein